MNKIFDIRVPPDGKVGADILIVGEAPGERESEQQKPFVGPSGDILNNVLMRHGLDRSEVYVMNLCEFQPAGNKFENLEGSWQLKEGLEKLVKYIIQHPPKVIITLGAHPTQALTGHDKIKSYRGSILPCIINKNIKVIPTVHPAYVLRDQSNYPVFDLDIKRAIGELAISGLQYPEYSTRIAPKGVELEEALEEILLSNYITLDIESVIGTTHILCLGIGLSNTKAVCLVNDNSSEYRHAVARILESDVKKILANGSFDEQMLYLNGFKLNNYFWDTQIAQHILNPELPKSLAFLTSIYTRQPYYKDEGYTEEGVNAKKVSDKLWLYNCKDCCVTYDIAMQQMVEIKDSNLEYQMQFALQIREVAQEISRNGILVAEDLRDKFRTSLNAQLNEIQGDLNKLAQGEINVNSPKQVQQLLYGTWKLPPRSKRSGGVTTDEDAIVASIAWAKNKYNGVKTEAAKQEYNMKLIGLKLILKLRGIRKLLSSYIDFTVSNDGRVRSSYKTDSTETNRWSAELFVDGTGINSQTTPRDAIEI
jgi:DNA polymerase